MREHKSKMFSKRHYEAMAYALARARPGPFADVAVRAQWETAVYHVKNVLSHYGESFDAQKFDKAIQQTFG